MSHWTSNAISAAYATFRPSYPAALFAAVARRCAHRGLCIDVGCGSGQATTSLLAEFQRVVGVDPSASQIAHAPANDRARYFVGGAESFATAALGDAVHQADCVTVAQAIHWFHMPTFMQQVDRALKQEPGAVLAFWSYPLCTVTSHPEVDRLLKAMDAMLMRDGYWPPERKHVDNHYADIWVPEYFPEASWVREVETFPVAKQMSLHEFVSYLSTMSGVSRYQQQNVGTDLLGDFHSAALKIMTSATPDTVATGEETAASNPESLLLDVEYCMETYFATRK